MRREALPGKSAAPESSTWSAGSGGEEGHCGPGPGPSEKTEEEDGSLSLKTHLGKNVRTLRREAAGGTGPTQSSSACAPMLPGRNRTRERRTARLGQSRSNSPIPGGSGGWRRRRSLHLPRLPVACRLISSSPLPPLMLRSFPFCTFKRLCPVTGAAWVTREQVSGGAEQRQRRRTTCSLRPPCWVLPRRRRGLN